MACFRLKAKAAVLRKVNEFQFQVQSCDAISSFDEPLEISEVGSIFGEGSIFSDECGSNYSSDNDSLVADINESEDILKLRFRNQLAAWALNVPKVHVNGILKLLRTLPCHNDLPCDYRSLLKTPRVISAIDVFPGKYVHVGLQIGIERLFSKRNLNAIESIDLIIFVDGFKAA